jgi:hypothetical protein
MDDGTELDPAARLPIPATGGGCCALGLIALVGFFVWLAIDNLIAFSTRPVLAPLAVIGVIASVLWPLIVVVALYAGISAIGGLRMFAIHFLSAFARWDFVEVRRTGDNADRTVIGFGYKLFGLRFYYLRLEPAQILALDMSTGQATAFAGKDMNDWSVLLWYRDPTRPERFFEGRRIDEVYIVGPAQARAVTEERFRAVAAFLRAAGVELHPTEKEYELRAGGSGDAPLTPSPPSPSA